MAPNSGHSSIGISTVWTSSTCTFDRAPHLNGTVERSHRVDDQEFYQLLDADGIADDIVLFNAKLREWEDYYNCHRPHGALGGQTPYERQLS
jgi:transposase InsO family protein